MSRLAEMLHANPFVSYTYSYPHKTAYRVFDSPLSLENLWCQEDRSALFLYLHVPFCEMRCGFCNLFTLVNTEVSLEKRYLEALKRQAARTANVFGSATYSRFAIGGGTPTYLDVAGLEALFELSETIMGANIHDIPASVETSPLTAEPEKLHLLRSHGVDRISIGVQSFNETEVRAVGRAQKTASVEQALRNIRDAGFPTLNIDLIYGLPGQTVASWLDSIRAALAFQPEELYLYPLYVRPLTGISRTGLIPAATETDIRLDCYRAARDLLLDAGYTQITMRMFRASHAPATEGPVYCVQEDGMVGLGCGARSYTQTTHYSSEYAVGARGIRAILADYINKPASDFDLIRYGVSLNNEERRRRYVIKSILEAEGLEFAAYTHLFGTSVWDDLPELSDLVTLNLAAETSERLSLNTAGLEHSDTIGPWLYSTTVKAMMEAYELR